LSPLPPVWAKAALVLALASITWEALLPGGLPLPGESDKLAHLGSFLLLALLADRAWPALGFTFLKWLPLLGYGLAIELLQTGVPGRDASLADWGADALGLAIYALWLAFRRGLAARPGRASEPPMAPPS
jgi:hypothetical protein